MKTARIRSVDANSAQEVGLVAARMRQTLIEVLGEERGVTMSAMDWLVQRVLFHLDPMQSTGEVFVAEDSDGHITGHTIVRLDTNEAGKHIGLFSTIYVEPESRRQSVAARLIERGEQWMASQGVSEFNTYTDEGNKKLIRLFEGAGYAVVDRRNEFVKLGKTRA